MLRRMADTASDPPEVVALACKMLKDSSSHYLIETALDVLGTRSAMLLLTEAFCGARRFDDLVERAGVSTMIGAQRLKELVSAGLLTKLPYYQSEKRTKYEYVLTELGQQTLPVLVAFMRFGSTLGASCHSEVGAAGPGSCELAGNSPLARLGKTDLG